MAADSDGCVQTVLTCKGDLGDPHFPRQFKKILANLKQLLFKGSTDSINLQKVEPWNSVRVTFTIPKEAAVRLRQLAQQGNATLLQLGILSVQVEGDEVISLRMANRYGGEPQEIVMHTGGSSTAPSTSSSTSSPEHSAEASNVIRSIAQSLSQLPGTSGTSAFKSPNVVAPLDSEPIPLPPSSPAQYHTPPFPFASMTHAAHAIHSRETLIPPPPPYPGPSRSSHPANVALSSPLLVNLLQNDGFAPTTSGKSTVVKSKPLPVPKTEQVPNSAFFNTKLPESSVHLPNSNLSQVHIASSNSSQIHLSNSNSIQNQSSTPNPISSQLHVANPIVLSNHSSQIHVGNPNSQIHIGNPNPPQIHLANSSSSQIHLSNPNSISSQSHPSTPNSSSSFIVNPNHNPTSLAQTTKASQSPFLTKQQSVVNQALYSRHIHQSVSTQSQTTMMRPHSQTPISLANSNNLSHPQPQPIPNILQPHPIPNTLHTQSKPAEPQVRFPIEPSPAPPPLPPPPPPPVSNNVHVNVSLDVERPPQNHQQTMVEAKDFTPSPAKLPSPMSSVPLPIPLPPAVVKTDDKAIGSDHNKTENVKFSETSQTSHVNSKKQPVMLINPLTGDLEPIPSEVEEVDSSQLSLVNSLDDPFFNFPSPFNDPSNSLFSDDDDVTSILNKKPDSIESTEPESAKVTSIETKSSQQQTNEKIKLRLKLEKNEPVMPVYKADVSFVQGVRKIRATASTPSNSITNIASNTIISSQVGPSETTPSSSELSSSNSSNPEEPKVPPLHISLRGRNAAVVVNCKDEKKWKEGFKAAASGVKKANKAAAGSGLKENANLIKKNLVFTQHQQFTEENEEEVDDEEESEDEEEDDDEEEDNEDEEQDGEDTDDDDDDEENDERDVEQNLKTRLEPGEIVSPYSTPIRTAYPTAEEVTSILRSMPSDTHHKMSLSFPKEVKKKESIKKQIHQRLVEGPLSLFHKNTKSKLKSSNSLLKSVVKRAKEARMLSAVRHSTDKQRAIGNGVQRKPSSEKETTSTATQSPTGAPNRKFKSNRQPSIESSKTIVPLNHNSPDIVKKIVNNMNKLCNTKNKDNSTRNKDNNVVNNMANFSNVTVNTVTNASTSNPCSFNKNFAQTNSQIQNKKLKDFHMLSDKDLANFNKVGLKSISSLLNNTIEPFTNLENNSCLLPIIHDIELTEKKIKQKMLESEKAQQLHQLQQEQQMMTAFAETEMKSISTSTMHDSKLDNTRNSTESIRQENVRSSTENNVNQSEPGNSQGEDSGIESMDALSEKSPNQSSESPLYKNNEKDEKTLAQSISTIHGIKPEKIARTSSIEIQVPPQTIKRESVDTKTDCKLESTPSVKKETKESCDKIEDIKSEPSSQAGVISNQGIDKVDKDKVRIDLRDVKAENVNSPTLEDPQPIRITPALYTYSNSEKVREDTPSPNLLEEEEEEQCGNSTLNTRPKRKRKLEGSVQTLHDDQKSDATDDKNPNSPNNSKSLLEQLLIEIPMETRVEPRRSITTRNTRSQNKFCDMSPEVATSASSGSSASSRTPHSSPSLPSEPPQCKPSPNQTSSNKPRAERGKNKRGNSNSTSSGTSVAAPADATSSSDESNTARPNKRKCSENAAELIKACMGVEDNFHLTGKKQLLDPSSGAAGSTTPTSTSPPAKAPRKKGTDVDSDDEAPLSDILVKHNKSCDTTVKTPSSNSISSQPVSGNEKEKSSAPVSSSPSLPNTCTSGTATNSAVLTTNSNSSPLIRTSSRINESKTNRRSNRQNKAANDNPKKAPQGNNNNKSACGLMKNNNCITRGASKATSTTDEALATVRRKTRSANVHDSELGPGKRRRSSKDAK